MSICRRQFGNNQKNNVAKIFPILFNHNVWSVNLNKRVKKKNNKSSIWKNKINRCKENYRKSEQVKSKVERC